MYEKRTKRHRPSSGSKRTRAGAIHDAIAGRTEAQFGWACVVVFTAATQVKLSMGEVRLCRRVVYSSDAGCLCKRSDLVCMKNEASDTAPALAALHDSNRTKKPGIGGVVSLYCLQR